MIRVEDLATRRWISGFGPRAQLATPPAIADADRRNIAHAADIGFNVNKNRRLEACRFARVDRTWTQARS